MAVKKNMGVFPSGQWGQTVNLLLSASVVRIHPRPPRTPVSNGYRSFCFYLSRKRGARVDSNSIDPPNSPAGKKAPVQQRRPLPAAETGRSCWGCGQQDARAAQGTIQPLGAATRAPFLRGSRNPPAPAKQEKSKPGTGVSVLSAIQKGCKGRFEQYRFILSPPTDIASAPDL